MSKAERQQFKLLTKEKMSCFGLGLYKNKYLNNVVALLVTKQLVPYAAVTSVSLYLAHTDTLHYTMTKGMNCLEQGVDFCY